MKKFLLVVLLGSIFTFLGSIYVVEQTEQALVLQFGEPIKIVNKTGANEPGLHFKRPFIFQTIVKFDKRILDLNAEPKELIASDKSRVIIDAFAKYRIVDPLKFHQRVGSEKRLLDRLSPILDSRLREVIGSVPLDTLFSVKRTEIMKDVRDNVNSEVQEIKGFGIEIVDLRIMRADLPKKNMEAIYERMRTDREKEAKEYRAEGVENAKIITSTADKEKTVLLAEAEQKAQVLRGEGEAEATKIFADSFGKDIEFFTFYRSMQAYRETLGDSDTRMVLSPDSDFLRYFSDQKGEK